MNSLVKTDNRILPMNKEALNAVRKFEEYMHTLPQLKVTTQHTIHGGMYSRTVMVPAGAAITGALIKVPTILILQGEAVVYVGSKATRFSGYNVVAASANRKQAIYAITDTYITMIFKSQAKNVEEAEVELTDEYSKLVSNRCDNDVIITGE